MADAVKVIRVKQQAIVQIKADKAKKTRFEQMPGTDVRSPKMRTAINEDDD